MEETAAVLEKKIKVSLLGITSLGLGVFISLMILSVIASPSGGALNGLFSMVPWLVLGAVLSGLAAIVQRIFANRFLWWLGFLGMGIAITWAILIFLCVAGMRI